MYDLQNGCYSIVLTKAKKRPDSPFLNCLHLLAKSTLFTSFEIILVYCSDAGYKNHDLKNYQEHHCGTQPANMKKKYKYSWLAAMEYHRGVEKYISDCFGDECCSKWDFKGNHRVNCGCYPYIIHGFAIGTCAVQNTHLQGLISEPKSNMEKFCRPVAILDLPYIENFRYYGTIKAFIIVPVFRHTNW